MAGRRKWGQGVQGGVVSAHPRLETCLNPIVEFLTRIVPGLGASLHQLPAKRRPLAPRLREGDPLPMVRIVFRELALEPRQETLEPDRSIVTIGADDTNLHPGLRQIAWADPIDRA